MNDVWEEQVLDQIQRVEFWFSDETMPFARFRCDKLVILPTHIDVFNVDYTNPIASIFEYDYFRIFDVMDTGNL